MEPDFIWFAAMLGILIFPFAMIFLILNGLKWNERQSLFADCWFVYLAWLFSGFLTLGAWAAASEKFRIYDINPYLPVLSLSIVVIQSFGIVAVLYWRSRSQKVVSFMPMKESTVETPPAHKIFKTAFLVSVLTFLMILGLIVAVQDITGKLSPANDNGNEGGVSFGIYD